MGQNYLPRTWLVGVFWTMSRQATSVCLSVGWLIHREATASQFKTSFVIIVVIVIVVGYYGHCVSFHCTYTTEECVSFVLSIDLPLQI